MNMMKKIGVGLAIIAIGLFGVVTLSGCGESSDSASPEVKPIVVYGCEPQHPLVSTNTTETCGGDPLDLMNAALVSFDEKGNVLNDLAENILTKDNKVFEVTLKEGLKFSNGEPITSQSFIKAWNYGALISNGQSAEEFFQPIKGYDAVSAVDAEDKPAPTAKEMSGLKEVDATHFNITLAEPSVTFKIRLGHTAFDPIPESAFDADGKLTEGYGEHPVASGPYKLAAWVHDEKIQLVPNENYTGEHKAKNGGVTFKTYTGLEAAYSDLQSRSLDVIGSVPSSQTNSFRTDSSVVPYITEGTAYQGLTIPGYLQHFGWDEEGQLRRTAISKAIDRETIINQISAGLAVIPTGFAPSNPIISGAALPVEGSDVFKFDATEAKALWAKADAISKFENPSLNLIINGDGGGKSLFEAITNSIKNNLGIESKLELTPDFKTLLQMQNKGTATGATRNGWQADYPSIENYITQQYLTGAGSNVAKYSNKEFDNLLLAAEKAPTLDEANVIFAKAQAILAKDLPSIPLYDNQYRFVTSTDVDNASVKVTWKSVPDYVNIVKK
ncbi:MAG: ABC transporter substrate-binding protein [Candidatus Ancillula sp.]|jgi:oligopeptide transport system substrate-binding protein|nr:ABC transporter substrate-binding protein [Candidatus Ancillula sp.]